jgi:hypothetical protein
MWPVSDEFKQALVYSHRAVCKVEVWKGGVYQRDLDIVDGQVTVDDQPIRRRISVALTDKTGELVPAQATDLLGVVDSELRAYRGIRFVDGSEELVPQGVFDIATMTLDDSGEGLHMRVEGYDRARRVIRAKMTNEYLIAEGTNYLDAIMDLVSFRYPAVIFSAGMGSTALTTPQIVLKTGDDPWAKAQKMALEGLGCDLYFNMVGELTCSPVVDPTTAPIAWSYLEGEEATFLYINRQLTNEETWNHVIVTAENPERAISLRAEVKDENPFSPTYYLGAYGDVVDWIFTELAPANAVQATVDEIALAIYNKRLGFVELVRFNAIVNPAHEINDAVAISRQPSKIDGNVYMVDKITLPLVTERPMDIATRKRRV